MQGDAATGRHHLGQVSGKTIYGMIEVSPTDRMVVAYDGRSVRRFAGMPRQRCSDGSGGGHERLAIAAG
jgi:hypothetical protein